MNLHLTFELSEALEKGVNGVNDKYSLTKKIILIIKSFFMYPHKPGVLLMGHRQTVQSRVSNDCIQNVLFEFELKKIPPNSP